jgi:hypothetical protein
MATNVKARILLKCRVCVINPTKAGHLQDPKEGKQWHNIHHCTTATIDYNEWMWRFETAKKILCAGYADTTGYYYGDVIGGEWTPDGQDIR